MTLHSVNIVSLARPSFHTSLERLKRAEYQKEKQVKMRTLCVLIVCCAALAQASLQTHPPRPQCGDERVNKLWAGLPKSVTQPERAPFQVEMERLGRSTRTGCGVQFNGELFMC